MSYMLYKGSFAASLRTDPSVPMSMYMQAILLPRAGCIKLPWQTVYIFVNGAMIHAWACSKEARKGTYSYRDCRPRTTSVIAADNVACVTSWSLLFYSAALLARWRHCSYFTLRHCSHAMLHHCIY